MARAISRNDALSAQFAAKAAELLAAEDDRLALHNKIRNLKSELGELAGIGVGSIIDTDYISHTKGEVWQFEGCMDSVPIEPHQDKVYLAVYCNYRPITKTGKPSKREKHQFKTVTRWDVWANWSDIKNQSLQHRLTSDETCAALSTQENTNG